MIESLEERLDAVHASWFELPASALLSGGTGFSSSTKFSSWKERLKGLPDIILSFWQRWLWQEVVSQQWVPKALLPDMGELEPLLRLDKQQLVELIDILGVFDIVVNLRRAVHPDEQKLWGAALSERQKQVARRLMQQPNWAGQAPLPLGHNDPREINRQLHMRGCLRLAAALHGLQGSFIWYISHRLDRGRGDLILRGTASDTSPEAVRTARRSLQWALHELAPGESS